MKPSEYILKELIPLQEKLNHHPIYQQLNNERHVRFFMESHVFAVWDFMSLVKSLQIHLTGLSLPWVPPKHPDMARFINEIVLGEESDLDPDGNPKSHFELYLAGMKELGASTQSIQDFVKDLESGSSFESAIQASKSSGFVKAFVQNTFETIKTSKIHEIAANFAFCREDMIPEMFQEILDVIDPESKDFTIFRYYLSRHIELDGDDHGPLAMQMIDGLCTTETQVDEALEAAKSGLTNRINLWDGISDAMSSLS